MNEQRAAKEQSIATAALRTTTISLGQQTRGVMFFPRDNGCARRIGCEILVTLAIDGTMFEFPMPFVGNANLDHRSKVPSRLTVCLSEFD